MVYAQMSFFVETDADNLNLGKCVDQYCAFAKTIDKDTPKNKLNAFIKSIHPDRNKNSESAACVGLLTEDYGLATEGAESLERQCAQNTSGNRKQAWGANVYGDQSPTKPRPPGDGQRRQQEEEARRKNEREAWLQKVRQHVPNEAGQRIMRVCQTYISDFYTRCFPPAYMKVSQKEPTIEELDSSMDEMRLLLPSFFKQVFPEFLIIIDKVLVAELGNVEQTSVLAKSYTSLHDFSRKSSESFKESIDTLEELVYMYLKIGHLQSAKIKTLDPKKKEIRKKTRSGIITYLKDLVNEEVVVCYIVWLCCDHKPAHYTKLAKEYVFKLESWTGNTLPNRFERDKDMSSFLDFRHGLLFLIDFLVKGIDMVANGKEELQTHTGYKERKENYAETEKARKIKKREKYLKEKAEKLAREAEKEAVESAEAQRQKEIRRENNIKKTDERARARSAASTAQKTKVVNEANTHRQSGLTREERKSMIHTLREEYIIPSRVLFHPTFDTTLQTREENDALRRLLGKLNGAILKPSDIKNIKLKTGILDQVNSKTIIWENLLSVMIKTQYRRYMLITAWEKGENTADLLKQYRLSEDISTNHLKLYHLMANTEQLKYGVPTEEELRKLERGGSVLAGEEKEKLFSLKLALIYYERGKSETEDSKKQKIYDRISYFKTKYEAMFGENESFDLLLEDLSDTK